MPGILFFGNQPETHVVTTFRFALSLLSWLVFVAYFLAPAEAAGPLSVGSSNPRFFVDSNGKPVYLIGVHLNNDLVDCSDKAALHFTSHLNFPQAIRTYLRALVGVGTAWIKESTAKIPSIPCLIRERALERRSMGDANLI